MEKVEILRSHLDGEEDKNQERENEKIIDFRMPEMAKILQKFLHFFSRAKSTKLILREFLVQKNGFL